MARVSSSESDIMIISESSLGGRLVGIPGCIFSKIRLRILGFDDTEFSKALMFSGSVSD
ncbi:hypothetical protein NADFUDRAFT_47701 [Nadsonia fulvescens var. elongata DSM 6958]|uniref:Uncharacterized protein n=1 Tax=Nadsonia fulvescens var. elongata DSM 6958 TaxID=857566 RepID=A0A1E3PG52_9ASCO|nr:hypothetical protein NADFUDRAFT_47701 [Nadsonia fulvescens var. elongata DSM 6958]